MKKPLGFPALAMEKVTSRTLIVSLGRTPYCLPGPSSPLWKIVPCPLSSLATPKEAIGKIPFLAFYCLESPHVAHGSFGIKVV